MPIIGRDWVSVIWMYFACVLNAFYQIECALLLASRSQDLPAETIFAQSIYFKKMFPHVLIHGQIFAPIPVQNNNNKQNCTGFCSWFRKTSHPHVNVHVSNFVSWAQFASVCVSFINNCMGFLENRLRIVCTAGNSNGHSSSACRSWLARRLSIFLGGWTGFQMDSSINSWRFFSWMAVLWIMKISTSDKFWSDGVSLRDFLIKSLHANMNLLSFVSKWNIGCTIVLWSRDFDILGAVAKNEIINFLNLINRLFEVNGTMKTRENMNNSSSCFVYCKSCLCKRICDTARKHITNHNFVKLLAERNISKNTVSMFFKYIGPYILVGSCRSIPMTGCNSHVAVQIFHLLSQIRNQFRICQWIAFFSNCLFCNELAGCHHMSPWCCDVVVRQIAFDRIVLQDSVGQGVLALWNNAMSISNTGDGRNRESTKSDTLRTHLKIHDEKIWKTHGCLMLFGHVDQRRCSSLSRC